MNVRCDGILTIRQGIEIAVAAFMDAERNVDIETLQIIPPNNKMHPATLEYLVCSFRSAATFFGRSGSKPDPTGEWIPVHLLRKVYST